MDNLIENIFRNMTSSIFKDRHVLSNTFIPPKLVARDEQIRIIAEKMYPVLEGGSPQNAVIHGNPGSGKTVVMKFVSQLLMKEMETRGIVNKVKTVFIRCEETNTPTRILYKILQSINPLSTLPPIGLGTEHYYNAIWKELRDTKLSLIIVFDEIDKIKEDSLLNNLCRYDEDEKADSRQFISVFGLTNDLGWLDNLDARLRSVLRATKIVFSPYNADHLCEILSDRVPLAFHENAVHEDVIGFCAAYSARDDGDARRALLLLQTSGMIAQQRNDKMITKVHVDAALSEVDKSHYSKLLNESTSSQKLILLSLICLTRYTTEKISTGLLYSEYSHFVKLMGMDQLSIQRVSGLISQLETAGFLVTTTRKGRKGNSRILTIDSAMLSLDALILSDPLLNGLSEAYYNRVGVSQKQAQGRFTFQENSSVITIR